MSGGQDDGVYALPSDCYQRATAFVTDPSGRLLVFDHIEVPASGTQVPAGGILAGEPPEEAVLRETKEESGITGARVVRALGACWFVAPTGFVPTGKEEQVHHAFHLRLTETPAQERWEWSERSGGDAVLHRFMFRWVDLDEAARMLHPIQAMWIASLRSSLAQGQGTT